MKNWLISQEIIKFFETGLKPDGSIETDNPYVWLFTGATADRKTDNNIDWYLGALYYPMLDGQQSGPPGLTAVGDIGKFYFNTAINKFVMLLHFILLVYSRKNLSCSDK